MTHDEQDHTALNREYTALNRRSAAQVRDRDAFRVELQSLTDTAVLAAQALNLPGLTQDQIDVVRRLERAARSAKVLLNGWER